MTVAELERWVIKNASRKDAYDYVLQRRYALLESATQVFIAILKETGQISQPSDPDTDDFEYCAEIAEKLLSAIMEGEQEIEP